MRVHEHIESAWYYCCCVLRLLVRFSSLRWCCHVHGCRLLQLDLVSCRVSARSRNCLLRCRCRPAKSLPRLICGFSGILCRVDCLDFGALNRLNWTLDHLLAVKRNLWHLAQAVQMCLDLLLDCAFILRQYLRFLVSFAATIDK